MPFNERTEIKLATWNLNGALSDPRRAETVAETIIGTDGQVISLQDAYILDPSESTPSGTKLKLPLDIFRDAGYEIVDLKHREVLLEGEDNSAIYQFMTLVKGWSYRRREILREETNAVIFDIAMQDFVARVVSVHLNDQSEKIRLRQVEAIKARLNLDMPTVVMGDFNSMHGDLMISKVTRARALRNPHPSKALLWLADKARGDVLREFNKFGLEDVDADRQPTMPSRLPKFQLDHVLVNDGLVATEYKVEHRPDESDHGLITSTVVLR